MAEFQVTSSQLKNQANEIRNLGTQFQASLENLSSAEQSLSSMWEGDAKETFRNAFQMSHAKMETYKGVINQYAAALDTIAQQYEQAESVNVSTANVG